MKPRDYLDHLTHQKAMATKAVIAQIDHELKKFALGNLPRDLAPEHGAHIALGGVTYTLVYDQRSEMILAQRKGYGIPLEPIAFRAKDYWPHLPMTLSGATLTLTFNQMPWSAPKPYKPEPPPVGALCQYCGKGKATRTGNTPALCLLCSDENEMERLEEARIEESEELL